MEFALLFYIDDADFADITPEADRKLQDDCRDEDADLERQGKLVAARALRPTSEAVTVRIRGSKVSRTDGPFAETKEHLGGIVILRADSMEEAILLAEQSALAKYAKVEVRPAYDIRSAP
ncbi:MAG TPA: YciI family protein [Rhizobiaceae bacterium]|nr:YciI family protein [Rhizobiaceae bacterium]